MKDIEIKKNGLEPKNNMFPLLVSTLLLIFLAQVVVAGENNSSTNVINEIKGNLTTFNITADGATNKLNNIQKEIDKLKEKVNDSKKIDELKAMVKSKRENIEKYDKFKNIKNVVYQRLGELNTDIETPYEFNSKYLTLKEIQMEIESIKSNYTDDFLVQEIKELNYEYNKKKTKLDEKLDETLNSTNEKLNEKLNKEVNLTKSITEFQSEKTNAEQKRNDAILDIIKSTAIPGAIFFILGVITSIILEKRRESKVKHDFTVDKW